MTYEEALKEAYKQPWKVDSENCHYDGVRYISLTVPISYISPGTRGNILAMAQVETELAEYIVNLHNKSLVEKVEYLVAYDPVASPPKSIHDLTDEQLLHIAKLAYGDYWRKGADIEVTMEIESKWRGKAEWVGVVITAVDKDPEYPMSEEETLRLWPSLNIDFVQDWDGGRGVSNQYQIYEYLRSLGIKPV